MNFSLLSSLKNKMVLRFETGVNSSFVQYNHVSCALQPILIVGVQHNHIDQYWSPETCNKTNDQIKTASTTKITGYHVIFKICPRNPQLAGVNYTSNS